MEETELRTRLDVLAFRAAPPTMDADELAGTVIARHRAGRRRQWRLAAVAAVAAAVLASVPAVRSALDKGSEPAAPSTSTGIYTIPTRGDLSEDLNFVQGVLRLPWTGGPGVSPIPEPALESRHVVFLGHVPNAVWALVAGPPPGDPGGSFAIAWFAGPSDATAADMTLQSVPRVVDADQPAALTDRKTTFALIVAAPDDRIEICYHQWIEVDGQVTCHFEPIYALDGVAFPGAYVQASIDRATRYRVVRDGTEFTGPVDAYPDPDFVPPPTDVNRLRPAPAPALGDAAVATATDEYLSRTGVSVTNVDFTVVWAGDLPMRNGGTARLSVVVAENHGGGTWVTGALGWDAGDGQVTTAFCGSEIRPAGTPIHQQVFVLRCEDTGAGQDPPTGTLVVVAPPEAGFAQAWHDDEFLGGFPLSDGVAVVPAPEQTVTIEVLDREYGRILDRRAPMGTADIGN